MIKLSALANNSRGAFQIGHNVRLSHFLPSTPFSQPLYTITFKRKSPPADACFVYLIIFINTIVIGVYPHGYNCITNIAYRAILNDVGFP